MEIPLNAKVECTDSKCGQVFTLVVNPVTRGLTHLVVHTPQGDRYLVPIAQIAKTSHDSIHLACTQEALGQMESLVATQYVEHQGLNPNYPAWQTVQYSPMVTPEQSSYYTEEEVERIPPGELAVRRGTKVEATDGHVGEVGELLMDPESGHITHLVLLEGHFWAKKEVTLPLSSIERTEGDTVHLKLDKKAIAQLPAISVRRHYSADR